MQTIYDLVGIGIGPFNLSLAALIAPQNKLNVKFCEAKKSFSWHPELMLDSAPMQTSFLKDLVTPVDPTNPYSFLNYLVKNDQFYPFLNTSRSVISRIEFQKYLQWVSEELGDLLSFNSPVKSVEYVDNVFKVTKENGFYFAKNLCVASGPKKNIPDVAKPFLGKNVFHAKSEELQHLDLENKRVIIVGGGQTGIEIFRNILKKKWGKAKSISLVSGRENLLPLDEGPFTNEIFTPNFVSNFHGIEQKKKDKFTQRLLLASDGNTPSYLQELYNELYMDKYYHNEFCPYSILPMRWMISMNKNSEYYNVGINNKLNDSVEEYEADIVILSTGFTSELPSFLAPIKDMLVLDSHGRPKVKLDYELETKFDDNKIFVMNYSRHGHGIADPQTSLMSWRSSVIANSLIGEELFKNSNDNSFIQYFN